MNFLDAMSVTASETTLVDSLARALWESFEISFDIWRFTDSWTCGLSQSLSDYQSHQLVADSLKFLGKRPRMGPNEPFVLKAETNSPVLVIPFRIHGQLVAAASATFPHSPPELIVRMAKLFIREFEQRQRIAQMTDENDAFVRQVTHDFEELTFLRKMAEHLEITDLCHDLRTLAEATLPALLPLIEAKGLVIVAAEEHQNASGETYDKPGRTLLWIGSEELNEDACTHLVEHYFRDAEEHAVVKNYVHRTQHAKEFPGLREFILTPIAKANRLMGWILAVNRVYDGGINPDDLPWCLSQFEFGTNEATLLSSTASILATHARNVELFREKELLLTSTVKTLVSAVEAKDKYTCGHSERVALYGKRLAQELGCSEEYCERLYLTGLLHDIGKIGVSDAVLKKAGTLTDEEFEEIKQHPDKGWAILYDLEPLRYVLPGVLHHHERIDGNGYPDRLVADEIPLDGRILAVVDAYDAMTSDRPYRTGLGQDKAEAILRAGAGIQWDAAMIDGFFRIMPDIIRIRESYQHRALPVRQKRPSICTLPE